MTEPAPWLPMHKIRCPECGNRVAGTLPGGVPVGPEAVGRPWPKHYRRDLAVGCAHYGTEHPILAEHVREAS